MKSRKRFFIILTTMITFSLGCPISSFPAKGTSQTTSPVLVEENSKPPSLSSQSQPVKANKKITAYCCVQGKVVKKVLSETDMKKNAGTCSTSKSRTTNLCGICCKNGQTKAVNSSKEKDICKKQGGQFYKNARECKPPSIYCCLQGRIKKTSSDECKKVHGKPYKTEKDARRNCGWCCAKNKVFSSAPSECKQSKGSYYTSRSRADQECKKQALCCVNGKLSTYSKVECKRNNGRYFTSTSQAKKQCRPKAKKRRDFSGSIQGIKPVRLPDLAVSSTSVNSNCFMKVTVRNLGGPIQASDHAAAKIHLSAGAGLISSKTKLISIDPGGQLLVQGGSITYTTKLRITQPNQATLVWIDTDHHILESNETNNGDDAILTCKTPLAWCCANDRVGKTTSSECEKLKGSLHKTETAALKACGIRSKISSPAPELSLKKKDSSALSPVSEIRGSLALEATQPKIPDMIPMIYDMGIRITLPTSTTSLYQGETFTVRYQFTSEAGLGDVSFTAFNRGTAIGYASQTVRYNPLTDGLHTREIELTFSSDVPVGEYFIMATHSESGAHGESDPFQVVPNSARINFSQPDTGDIFHPGGAIPIRYQFSRRVEPGLITFSLYTIESSTPLATTTQIYSPIAAETPLEKSWTVELPIPPGISSNHCFIVASHPRAIGTSNTFSIQPMSLVAPGPFDIEIIDIFREESGQVKVKVRPSNFSGRVNIQVSGNPTPINATVGPHETDIVVDEMPAPVILLGMETYSRGNTYEVTIDPLNELHEINESNNSLSKTLYYWESFGEVIFNQTADGAISPGGEVRVPCNLSDYVRGTWGWALAIKNYGSEPITRASGQVEVRQSGRRPRGDGHLGDVDFNEVITTRFYVSNCSLGERRLETEIPPGECGLVSIRLTDLTAVDSRLTFRFSGRIASWPLTINPYTVSINFGTYHAFSATCTY